MANMIIDFGKKYKGHQISECDEKYLTWLVSHEKVLAMRNRWASRDARFELERRAQGASEAATIAKIEEEVIETSVPTVVETAPVERKKHFDQQLCCEVYSDTGERCVAQVWDEVLQRMVTPAGSEEVLDVEQGLSWSYAVRRANSKARMIVETREIQQRKRSADVGLRGHLNGNRGFSLMR